MRARFRYRVTLPSNYYANCIVRINMYLARVTQSPSRIWIRLPPPRIGSFRSQILNSQFFAISSIKFLHEKFIGGGGGIEKSKREIEGRRIYARARFQSIRFDPSIRARIRDQSETSSLFVRALNPKWRPGQLCYT